MVREKKPGGFNGEELLDAVAEETEAPVMPAASDTPTNPSLVTTGANSNSEVVTTSEVAEPTLPPCSDVTSTTVNTTLTTSLATLNVSTDETKASVDLPEGMPLLETLAETQNLITQGSETEQSNRPVDEGSPVARNADMSPSQATVAELPRRCRRFTTGGAPASPRWPGEIESARRLFFSAGGPNQTPEELRARALAWAEDDIQVETNTQFINLTVQQGTLSREDVNFVTYLITQAFRQTGNTREELRRLMIMAAWLLNLLLVQPASISSFRRVMMDLMQPSTAVTTSLATPDSSRYGECLLVRQNRLSRSLHTPFDRRPQESSLSQNSMGAQSLRDEEQVGLEERLRENARVYTRNGDPMRLLMCTLNREQRAANSRRAHHGSEELDELTLPRSEIDRQTIQSVPRRRPSRVYGRSSGSRLSVDSVHNDLQQWESLLRTRDHGIGGPTRNNGYMDPSDNIVPLEPGEILVGSARSTSYRMFGQRLINHWGLPLRQNQNVPYMVLRYPIPRSLAARMPFTSLTFVSHGSFGIRLDGSSTDRSVTGISTVEMNGLDVNGLVQVERAVDGQGAIPRVLRATFPAVSPIVVPFNSTAPVAFSSEIGNTRGGSLGILEDAREGRRQVDELAPLSSESLQWSRTRSCPELRPGFGGREELEFGRYIPNELLNNSSSSNSSSEDDLSSVVDITDGFGFFDDNQEFIPVQDQVVDHSMPVVVDDYLSEGYDWHVTPEDSASDEADN